MKKQISKKSAYCVYILKCNDGSLYTGYTGNLTNRIKLHNDGYASKYTRARRPVNVVWSKRAKNRRSAMMTEMKIKKLKRQDKLKLIRGEQLNNVSRKDSTTRHPKVFIKTFGCQMNVADSKRMMGLLQLEGYGLAENVDSADVVLFNTCSVRDLAEHKVWSGLGKLDNKDRIIGVIGCMAQRLGRKIFRKVPYVNLVCGTYSLKKMPDLLNRVKAGEKKVIDVESNGRNSSGIALESTKKVVCEWVPIMRGCNNKCSYCIVPYVRGPERSIQLKNIVSEIEKLAAKGCQEVTLLGQNVNSYRDTVGFVGLLEKINAIKGIERIKFITSHPKDADIELFKAIAEYDKVCEYLHLPIQSGSNNILKKMNRRYTREQYLEKISILKDLLPEVGLSTDIIVGFPGETEEDFRATCSLMKEVEFDSAFIFKYSPRTGTPAFDLGDNVSLEIKKERNNSLLVLQDEICEKKNGELKGKAVQVLVEGHSKNNKNMLMGRTRTNKIVVFDGADSLIGKLVDVCIKRVTTYTLYGEIK